jgi:hypothetical protein
MKHYFVLGASLLKLTGQNTAFFQIFRDNGVFETVKAA